MDYNARIQRTQEELKHPVLISNLPNIRYLTGFAGSNAYLLVDRYRATFVTDGRYGEVAAGLTDPLDSVDLVVYRQGPALDALEPLLSGLERLGIEAAHASWDFILELRRRMNVELVPVKDVVEKHRRIKDAAEIALLTEAADAGDAAFLRIRELAAGAETEADLAWAINEAMRQAGAGVADWGPIVAAGVNSALPHHESGNDPLGSGLLLLDFGCVVDGYHSDMTRTISLGDPLDAELQRIWDAVVEAQARAVETVTAGVPAAEVDAAARSALRQNGLEVHFVHGTGHGVGLEIHEGPRLAADSKDVLEPGQVVTVEPGVYLPGMGGVRIEDTLVVTETKPFILNASSKELL